MVKQVTDSNDTVRIKFVRNTAYNGTDYGPDYPADTADVKASEAQIFLIKERAVPAEKAAETVAALNFPEEDKAITPAIAVSGSTTAEVARDKEPSQTTHVETAAGDIPPVQQLAQDAAAQAAKSVVKAKK